MSETLQIAVSVATVISAIVSWFKAGSAIEARKNADAAAREAQASAERANELRQEANSLFEKSNSIRKEEFKLSRKTFENTYLPNITFRYGASGGDTSDPTNCNVLIIAANEGYLPVMIERVGIHIIGSQAINPLFSAGEIAGTAKSIFPAEMQPGHILNIPISCEYLRDTLRASVESPDDEFVIRLSQPTWQFFETARLRAGDYMGNLPPIRVNLRRPSEIATDKPQAPSK